MRSKASFRAAAIRAELHALANPSDAKHLQRFFKTGPGQYAAGDTFLGIRVPVLRKVVSRHRDVPLDQAVELLQTGEHEVRAVALLIMVELYRRGNDAARAAVYRAYLDNTAYINNWDLVDSSAAQIIGAHLEGKSTAVLTRLARSESLWERRIAMIATAHFIKRNEFEETFRIATILLNDAEDLIHKAAGWMLREVGERDHTAEVAFLRVHCRNMPRTMLRYAIEKFPDGERRAFMK